MLMTSMTPARDIFGPRNVKMSNRKEDELHLAMDAMFQLLNQLGPGQVFLRSQKVAGDT